MHNSMNEEEKNHNQNNCLSRYYLDSTIFATKTRLNAFDRQKKSEKICHNFLCCCDILRRMQNQTQRNAKTER